jgi:hypothetical protein
VKHKIIYNSKHETIFGMKIKNNWDSGEADPIYAGGDGIVNSLGAERYCAKYAEQVECFDLEDPSIGGDHLFMVLEEKYVELIVSKIYE